MNLNKKNVCVILLIITFAILLFTAAQNLSDFYNAAKFIFNIISPFILGFCIAFILNVIMKYFEKNFFAFFRFKRQISLALSIFIVLGIIFILILIIIPEIKHSIIIIAENLPAYMDDISSLIINLTEKINISTASVENLNINWHEIGENIISFMLSDSSSLVNTTINVTSAFFSLIIDFILSIVFSIYLLLNKERLTNQLKRLLTAFITVKKVDKIFYILSVSNNIFSKFFIGQCVAAVILGLLCFFGMLIFGFPYAAMISCVIAVFSLIPMFGSIIGSIFGAILILLINPIQALWFVVFIIILEQLEGNILYPRIVGKSTGLPGIWVLVSVTLGGNIAGATGMLISVPVCSVLYYLMREHINSLTKDKTR